MTECAQCGIQTSLAPCPNCGHVEQVAPHYYPTDFDSLVAYLLAHPRVLYRNPSDEEHRTFLGTSDGGLWFANDQNERRFCPVESGCTPVASTVNYLPDRFTVTRPYGHTVEYIYQPDLVGGKEAAQ